MSAPALQDKLRRQLGALDDAALEALASKGLLRRARKDIDSATVIEKTGESDSGLLVRVGEHEVTLPDAGPAQARCSCPAAGICQHILAACLWLRDQPETEPAASPAEQMGDAERELLEITPDQMEKWAGRAKLRAALSLAAQAEMEISNDGAVTVRFRDLNATCRFVPGGGLDGAIVSGPRKDAQRLALAALATFQKSRGVTWGSEEETGAALAEASGAPRSREEVLRSTESLICETVQAGLAHATRASTERFATLSVSALAVNLPRLSLLLRGIGQELGLAKARDTAADLGRAFAALARAYALCTALDRAGGAASAHLVGWHRSNYNEVGHLELAGLAAWPWETASGYRGITVLFWDLAARRWNTWTDARPMHSDPGYDSRVRFTSGGPWTGAESPQQLSRSRFRLLRARRNAAGRLSNSSKSQTLVTGPSAPAELSLPVCTVWSEFANSIAPIGLADTNPLEMIRLIRPASWGKRFFDPTSQVFTWPLIDEKGERLRLQIHFTALDEPAIQALEAFDPAAAPGACVIGRIARAASEWILHPYSLLEPGGGIRHLNLDHAKAATPQTAVSSNENPADDFDDAEEDAPMEGGIHNSSLTRLLMEFGEVFSALSEGGSGALSVSRREEIFALVSRASLFGWNLLPPLATRLAQAPSLDPRWLLRCQHVWSLYRQSIEAG